MDAVGKRILKLATAKNSQRPLRAAYQQCTGNAPGFPGSPSAVNDLVPRDVENTPASPGSQASLSGGHPRLENEPDSFGHLTRSAVAKPPQFFGEVKKNSLHAALC